MSSRNTPFHKQGGNPQFITAGPGGALWFTEEGARRIGQITTSGVITEFVIPGSGRGAEDITAGSGGALWFTDPANSRVGRITTAGTVTYVAIPHDGPNAVAPGRIVSGPDSALWATDDQGTIDRVTTSGAVTECLDPAAFGGNLVSGPDGSLWLAGEIDGNPLQQITTAGVITTEGTLSGEGGGITTGPGNSIWFTILNPGEIDSVQLAAPPAGQGYRTAGSDGNVYPFGSDVGYGSLKSLGIHPAYPVVGIASIAGGYRLAGTDGGVFSFGDAAFHGSGGVGSVAVGLQPTPDGGGYWIATAWGDPGPIRRRERSGKRRCHRAGDRYQRLSPFSCP